MKKRKEEYIYVKEMAKACKIPYIYLEKSCQGEEIKGALFDGIDWKIPVGSKCPIIRALPIAYRQLLYILQVEKNYGVVSGIYSTLQIYFASHSMSLAGKIFSVPQVEALYLKNKWTMEVKLDCYFNDILEIKNHFASFDILLDMAESPLSCSFVQMLYNQFIVGKSPEIYATSLAEERVYLQNFQSKMRYNNQLVCSILMNLIENYNAIEEKKLEDILSFYMQFMQILPLQQGNGIIGRMLLFKEILKHNIKPFLFFVEDQGILQTAIAENNLPMLIELAKLEEQKFMTILNQFHIQII